jgi:hypothetical protein
MNKRALEMNADARRYLLASICLQWRFHRFLVPAGIMPGRRFRARIGDQADDRSSQQQPAFTARGQKG